MKNSGRVCRQFLVLSPPAVYATAGKSLSNTIEALPLKEVVYAKSLMLPAATQIVRESEIGFSARGQRNPLN